MSFISSGTSSQSALILLSLGLMYVTILSMCRPSIGGPHGFISILLYISNALRRSSVIHSGSFFSFEICLTISGVRPSATLYTSSSTLRKSYRLLSTSSTYVFSLSAILSSLIGILFKSVCIYFINK